MKNIIFKTILSVHKNEEISKQVKHTVIINVPNRLKNQHSNYRKVVTIAKCL